MSGSVSEVQEFSDQILDLLGIRIKSGQLVIHYNDGIVQRCETNTVHRATSRPLRKLDAPPREP